MAEKEINALLIEDNPSDVILLQESFAGHDVSIRMEVASRLSDGLDRLRENKFDVVLLDLNLPDSTGLATLTSVKNAAPAVPLVVLTGTEDETIVRRAKGMGAHDCLIKGNHDSSELLHSIRLAMLKSGLEEVRNDIDTREQLSVSKSFQTEDSSSSDPDGAEAPALPGWLNRVLVHRVGYVMDAAVGVGTHGNSSNIPDRLQFVANELRKRKVSGSEVEAIVNACVQEKTSGAEVKVRLDYQQEGKRMLAALMQMIRE